MTASNLPPGCTSADGLTPDDTDWELFIDSLLAETMSAADARRRWESQPDLLVACIEALRAFDGDVATNSRGMIAYAIAKATSSMTEIEEKRLDDQFHDPQQWQEDDRHLSSDHPRP